MKNDQKNIFIAIALSALVLVGWQFYFGSKPKNDVPVIATSTSTLPEKVATTEMPKTKETAPSVPLARASVGTDKTTFDFTGNMMLLQASGDETKFLFSEMMKTAAPWQVFLIEDSIALPLDFVFEKASPTAIKGYNRNFNITVLLTATTDGKLEYRFTSPVPHKYRFVISSTTENTGARKEREFMVLGPSVSRVKIGSDNKGEDFVQWFGMSYNYDVFITTFSGKTSASWSVIKEGKLIVDTNAPTKELSGNVIYTLESYDHLKALGENLKLAVDFGWFFFLEIPMMQGLQFFYKYFPNYGVAIILLTILVRLLTFPLQFKSYKSMKKMQDIQPQIQAIKEKFKDDKPRLNQETMTLFKRAGVNPVGGCFPLLLQLPIFIAFYKVLYVSVELVNAPFILWIKDLSVKDPYYVLPVLMAVSMFIQQKMTPSPSADPAQQKILLFMPLIFGFMMKDLQAGLNLYIFVSTLFGIIQQKITYRMIA